MNNHTTSITTNKKHHYRELLAIGIPIIIGQLGTIILGFADTLMIGHHSTPELAANCFIVKKMPMKSTEARFTRK